MKTIEKRGTAVLCIISMVLSLAMYGCFFDDETATNRLFYNGSWYSSYSDDLTYDIGYTWSIPENAESISVKAAFSENEEPSIEATAFVDSDLQMFLLVEHGDLSKGESTWQALYVRDDYELPSYKDFSDIRSITLEIWNLEKNDCIELIIDDETDKRVIFDDLIRGSNATVWEQEGERATEIPSGWSVEIQFNSIGADYYYGELIPMNKPNRLCINKASLSSEPWSFSSEILSIWKGIDLLPISNDSFRIFAQYWNDWKTNQI